ncbi:MAG: hypothetical protein M3Y24_04510 [Acidobacteriota bacterium]|nr:hypothetical protein [Acidobacteriota bacterium]
MRAFIGALCLAGVSLNWMAVAQENEQIPRLLLTPQRLRRLQRDRERQTVRWLNFEKRVQTVPDSPERGFELALYYAVTHDDARGREAAAWANAHPCNRRQVSLIVDWASELVGEALKSKLLNCLFVVTGPLPPIAVTARDVLFSTVVAGHIDTKQTEHDNRHVIDDLPNALVNNPSDLYAAIEYLMTIRSVTRIDPRQQDGPFFSQLPKQLLLSLKPEQIEHPDWMTHIAALAYVALDPNLENSQFLQGWAMEDSQMLREGPGTAYEFLWADPYLPGIAYQNMDPWIYNANGRLFARTDWEPNACWIQINVKGMKEQGCSPNTRETSTFGTLTLSRVSSGCVNLPPQKRNETAILWGLKPGAQLTLEKANGNISANADPAGMWSVPNEVTGKVCVSKHDRR